MTRSQKSRITTNLGVHLKLLSAILPSAHQDGPPASSHSTAKKCTDSESEDGESSPKRLTLRRIEVQNKPLVAGKVGFPYEPIKDEVSYDESWDAWDVGRFGG